MCKRTNPTDPLVRKFLQTYNINLLPLPRAVARPGELYVKTAGKVKATPGWIGELVEPEVDLDDAYSEKLPDLNGVVSETVGVDFGLTLLANFLIVLGIPPGIIDKVKLGYHHKRADKVAFQFANVTRESIDPFTIGSALIDHRLKNHPWVRPGNQYYVAAAFVRSRSIVVHAKDSSSRSVDVGAGLVGTVDADAGVTAERAGDGAMDYHGKKSLAIGVELYDLEYDTDDGTFLMGAQRRPVGLMHAKDNELAPAFPAEDDEALLEIGELEEPAAATG